MDFNNFKAAEFTLADAVGRRTDAGSIGYGSDAGSVDYGVRAFRAFLALACPGLPWLALACPGLPRAAPACPDREGQPKLLIQNELRRISDRLPRF